MKNAHNKDDLSRVYSSHVSGKPSVMLSGSQNSSFPSFSTFEKDPQSIELENSFLKSLKNVVAEEEKINPTVITNNNNLNSIKSYSLEDAIKELALTLKKNNLKSI